MMRTLFALIMMAFIGGAVAEEAQPAAAAPTATTTEAAAADMAKGAAEATHEAKEEMKSEETKAHK